MKFFFFFFLFCFFFFRFYSLSLHRESVVTTNKQTNMIIIMSSIRRSCLFATCLFALSLPFVLTFSDGYSNNNNNVVNNDNNVRDTVRSLKSQVNALLERRQEDFNILEESIRRSLDKNSELATLRKDLNDLR